MMREKIGNAEYWNIRITEEKEWIEKAKGILLVVPSKNPVYAPQFSFDLASNFLRLILRRFSRGDSVALLTQHFIGVLDAWELSNRLADEICTEHKLKTCRDWSFQLSNLNHYNWCFWLVGLALSLEVPEDQWLRLLALISEEGSDVLLDRIIASRQPKRKIGTQLLHAKPYARLLAAIDAPADKQAKLLLDFVTHWYVELKRKGNDELWWYIYGDPVKHPLEMGSYFGRWCLEAVAATKAFALDDSLCLGHPNYPGDLLRPSMQTELRLQNDEHGSWLTRWFRKGN